MASRAATRKARPAARPAPAKPALEPGHFLLSDIAQVRETFEAKGYRVLGFEWDNKMGAPRLVVARPGETVTP